MNTILEEKTRYSEEELKEFEVLITNKLEDARGELNYIREALHKRNDPGTDVTAGSSKPMEDGADTSEKSSVMFAKDKGIAENFLFNLKFHRTYSFRPGYIYPVTKRNEPNFGYKLTRLLYKPFLSKILIFITTLFVLYLLIGIIGRLPESMGL